MTDRQRPEREIPRFDGMPPGAQQRPQERPQTMAEQWDAQTHTDWKRGPSALGRLLAFLLGFSIQSTIVLTILCGAVILAAIIFGGGGNG